MAWAISSRSAPQFIAHPDLPVQLRNGEPPNADDPTTLLSRREGMHGLSLAEQDRGNNQKPVSISVGKIDDPQ
jgi:hypothetical protein